MDPSDGIIVSHSPSLQKLASNSETFLLSYSLSDFICHTLVQHANMRTKLLYDFLLEKENMNSYRKIFLETDSNAQLLINFIFHGELNCTMQVDHRNGKIVFTSSRSSEDQNISTLLSSVENLINADCSKITEHLQILKKHSVSEFFIRLSICSGFSVSRRFPFEARNYANFQFVLI
jgi:hypothetical protein